MIIAFLFVKPIRNNIPMTDITPNSCFVISIASIAPTSDSGSEMMMISGSVTFLNSKRRTSTMLTIPNNIVNAKLDIISLILVESPPKSKFMLFGMF